MHHTYRKIITAGAVSAPPTKKKAPGSVLIVAAYSEAYIGAYTSGIRASATPNKEFTLPSSSLSTNLVAIDLIAIKDVPFNISTSGAAKMLTICLSIHKIVDEFSIPK